MSQKLPPVQRSDFGLGSASRNSPFIAGVACAKISKKKETMLCLSRPHSILSAPSLYPIVHIKRARLSWIGWTVFTHAHLIPLKNPDLSWSRPTLITARGITWQWMSSLSFSSEILKTRGQSASCQSGEIIPVPGCADPDRVPQRQFVNDPMIQSVVQIDE